jgi:NAD/NADP transhydrogenase alpha subunit
MPDLPTVPDFNAAASLVAAALFAAGVGLCALAAAYVAKVLGQWWRWRK